jgi:ribonuclease P protein component
MIGRTHRFHGRGSIGRLYANGKSVRTGSLALKYSQNPKRREYRAAVVVSRKVSKSAVVRNRIRRRIYEHVRILSSSFTGPYDLVFTVFDEKIATVSPTELAADIAKLCKKAGLTSVKPGSRDIV